MYKRQFLDSFLKMAQKPTSRNSNKGDIEPASEEFRGVIDRFSREVILFDKP